MYVFADALELLDVVELSAATVVTMYVQGTALRWMSWKCVQRVLTTNYLCAADVSAKAQSFVTMALIESSATDFPTTQMHPFTS